MQFTEENIAKIFGNEAAESEDISNLRGYYFKSKIYNQVVAPVPLRILVGHKGIGKSALFTVASAENEEMGMLAVTIRPDDIVGIANNDTDFLTLIREWKLGLREVIYKKIVENFGVKYEQGKLLSVAGNIISAAIDSIAKVNVKGVELDVAPTKRRLRDALVNSRQVNVYIDDLDRGWEAKKHDIKKVSALLNAVRDLSSENSGLHFKISLRCDVYYLVRTADESTDKIEGSVVWHTWTNHEILALLVKRLDNFFGRKSIEAELLSRSQKDLAMTLNVIMDQRFQGKGKWENIATYRVLMSLIRRRPRDLVKLCTMAARQVGLAGEVIKTNHFEAIFDQYSQERLQDTINEYRSELPTIETLLLNMKPARKDWERGVFYKFSTADLIGKVEKILKQNRYIFSNGKVADAKDLAHFMYKINFLTGRKDLVEDVIDRKYFEEHRYVSSRFADFGYSWEIHPAYRWALKPESFDDIFNSLDCES